MFNRIVKSTGLTLALVLTAGIGAGALAQGRSGGHPSGPPAGSPSGNQGGNQGNPSSNSGGHADDGLGTASDRSNGRSDAGLDRARMGRGNASMPDSNELNRFQGIAKKLGTTPAALSTQYQAALAANPDLKFGQFVAANVVADNLNGRYPGVTSSSLLLGMQNGDSLGQTLKRLGVDGDQAKSLEKAAKRQIHESKKNH